MDKVFTRKQRSLGLRRDNVSYMFVKGVLKQPFYEVLMGHKAWRTASLFILAIAGAGCSDQGLTEVSSDVAPVHSRGVQAVDVKDRYIVTLRNDVADVPGVARAFARQHGGTLSYVYEHAIKGFAITLNPQAVDALRRNPMVTLVEAEAVVRGECDSAWWGGVAQCGAPWGLDRIDSRNYLDTKFEQASPFGSGVTIYILDSGIRTSHSDFGGRATVGFDTFGGTGLDCSGHGTHVAAIAGGATYGVAKQAQLVSVRVLDCGNGGTLSGVIAGVDWVTQNHVSPSVANMSLGSAASTSLDNAVRASIASGVTYVAAAGNNNGDACNISPARVAEAITVGASNISDYRWVGSTQASNYGTCLDFFAPGQDILSAGIASDSDSLLRSGTSMAAPHAAGVAAVALSRWPTRTPTQIHADLKGNASPDWLSNIGTGSPNLLLHLSPVFALWYLS